MSDPNQKPQPVLAQDQPKKAKPTAKEYLAEVNRVGVEMGFTMKAVSELFLQDNGTYSIKSVLQIVQIEEEK